MDLKKRKLEIDLRITYKTFVPPKPNPWVVSTWVVSKNRGHNPCVPIAQPNHITKVEFFLAFYAAYKQLITT